MSTYQGPTRPGTSVSTFRRTGVSGGVSGGGITGGNVKVIGGTVFIDGQGYSVAPSKQAEFIKGKTGGTTESSRQAIAEANKQAQAIRLAQERATQEARQLELARTRQSELAQQTLLKGKRMASAQEMSRVQEIQRGYIQRVSVSPEPISYEERERIRKAQERGTYLGMSKKIEEYEIKSFGPKKPRDREKEWKELKKGAPLLGVFDWGAEKTVATAEKISGPIGPGRETTKEVIRDIFLFAGTSQLMTTGAVAKKQKAVVKVVEKTKKVKKQKVTQEQIERYLEVEQRGKEFKILGRGTEDYQIKATKSRELLRLAETPEAKRKTMKVIQETYGKEFTQEFIAQGELGFLPSPTPTKPTIIIDTPPPPTMRGLGPIEATARPRSIIFTPTKEPTPKFKQAQKKSVKMATNVLSDVKVAQKVTSDTRTKMIQATTTLQRVIQKPKQAQDVLTKTILKSKTKSLTKQPSKVGTALKLELFKKIKKPVILIKETLIVQRDNSKITKVAGKYKVYVRRYGEWVLVGTYETLAEATAKLVRRIKTTLGASGFVERGGSKVPLRPRSGFRMAKREPNIIVQRRKFRLSTGGEVSEIISAKKSRGSSTKLKTRRIKFW